MAEFIQQGIDCFIDAVDIVDAAGVVLNVTGYTVEAVARAYYGSGAVVARWSSSPVGSQGLAIAGGAVIDRVRLVVTPEQTSAWNSMFVVVQAEMVSPAGQKSRPISKTYQVSYEAVV